MNDSVNVFNRQVIHRHRDRAKALFPDHAFLFREVADRLLERLDDVTRSFPLALDHGARGNLISEMLGARGGVETLVTCGCTPDEKNEFPVCADDEVLPFADDAFDLVLSNLSLHWINDLPGALSQIRRCLKPDGLMIASMFGSGTLKELRTVLDEAEIAVEGGLSPRVSPFADIRDIGGLLQRAGFALPVMDAETITVQYEDPLKLLKDLRGMGETNAVIARRKSFTRRETLMRAMDLYSERFENDQGRVPATFQVLYLSGWSPSPNQQKPMKPGSGTHSLTDVFGSGNDTPP